MAEVGVRLRLELRPQMEVSSEKKEEGEGLKEVEEKGRESQTLLVLVSNSGDSYFVPIPCPLLMPTRSM